MRLAYLWEQIRQSLWFIPAILTVVAAGAAIISVQVDRSITDTELLGEAWFVFDVGAEGARAVLSVIAQSVITVTGVVFSVTIVALQLAASQFTPRVLRAFLSDRGSHWVLGIFIGTFTFTLLVERTVGTPAEAGGAMVPSISVTISIVLSLVSIGALIYFINHVGQSIRASVILARLTADATAVIDDLFPSMIGDPADDREPERTPPVPDGAPRLVRASEAGYLQRVAEDSLFSIAEAGRAVIRMEPAMGHFVFPGETLASLWLEDEQSREHVEEIERKVRDAFILGNHWTLGQDLERALVELTDIAVRALSPSLNDPTTATQCVDRVGELLILLGQRQEPALARTGEAGKIRFIARRLTWERAVEIGFENIRNYAGGAPAVLVRMIEVCGRVRARVAPRRWPPLERQVKDVLEAARGSDLLGPDLARIERASEEALRDPLSRLPPAPDAARRGGRGPR